MRQFVWLALAAACALGNLGPVEAQSNQPNILFCIADDASYPHMSAYGCPWIETPGFDRVAREGLLFTNAYTPNAKCAPSRAALLTGRNSWQLEDACNHWCYFPAKFKTYCEALAENGYFVGKVAKGWGPGVALDAEGKPRQLTGQSFDKRKTPKPTSGINNTDYAANFADFLDACPDETPWCFWYGSTEPHRGYEYGSGVAKGGKSLDDVDDVPDYWPDNEVIRNDMLDYALEIEYFDHHLVRMLDMLEEQGQLDNTLVVVTSDNGMPFPRVKGQEYETSNHMPLAIMWRTGIAHPGRTVQDFVSFIDIAPTFVEVAGLDWEEIGLAPSPGRSLTDIFASNISGQVNPERSFVLIGKERHDIGRRQDQGYPIRGIVTEELLYLRNFEPSRWPAGNPETGYLNTDGSPTKTWILEDRRDDGESRFWELCFGKRSAEELYDLRNDPDCIHNLADDPAYAEAKAQLAGTMRAQLEAQGDPRMLGNGDIFERYRSADDANRNFYERYTSGEKVRAGWVNPTDFEEERLD